MLICSSILYHSSVLTPPIVSYRLVDVGSSPLWFRFLFFPISTSPTFFCICWRCAERGRLYCGFAWQSADSSCPKTHEGLKAGMSRPKCICAVEVLARGFGIVSCSSGENVDWIFHLGVGPSLSGLCMSLQQKDLHNQRARQSLKLAHPIETCAYR